MARLTTFFIFVFLIFSPFSVLGQTGQHLGEKRSLSYEIQYLEPLGITRVDSTGITYMPFAGWQKSEGEFLPVRYFGDYPLYFSGGKLPFRVILKNNSNRTYRNLKVETFQEFLNIEGNQGLAMGEDSKDTWLVSELGPWQEIVFEGEFDIPYYGESGIDQTHLRISHLSNSNIEKGQVILEDFQAGLWCPIP